MNTVYYCIQRNFNHLSSRKNIWDRSREILYKIKSNTKYENIDKWKMKIDSIEKIK